MGDDAERRTQLSRLGMVARLLRGRGDHGYGAGSERTWRRIAYRAEPAWRLISASHQPSWGVMFDLIVRGGRIVDGSGGPWFRGDVGIVGDRIAALGTLAPPAADNDESDP